MKQLHLDIETFSEVSLADCGQYRYAMDPSFRILLIAYAWNDDPVQIIDMEQSADDDLRKTMVLNALSDPSVIKVAHNAVFERVCFSTFLRSTGKLGPNEWLDARQWRCTMIQAVRCGYPQSLSEVGAAMGFEKQKMTEGRALIKLFCVPTKSAPDGMFDNGNRVLPESQPEKWELFKQYCIRDVEVERQIDKALSWYEPSKFEQELYAIDQRINDRGVMVDKALANNAVKIDSVIKARLNTEAIKLTGMSNPNSVAQLKSWLSEQLGITIETLRKTDLDDLRGNSPLIDRVLQIRAEMGKTSCAKYAKMLEAVCSDGRCRGLTQFYGSRTGRWAGRLIQLQNLPQNHIDELDFVRAAMAAGDDELIELTFGNVPDTMSQLIRTAFIAKPGYTFAVCDFSAIECRVLAWMAGEQWVLDTFIQGGDIYCATASCMFHVPVEKHGQNSELRQKGKIATLALGYGGGKGALDKMGGQRLGMTEDEETQIVKMWREANPSIVAFWYEVERTAKDALVYNIPFNYRGLTFAMHDSTLTIQLPSGRLICYPEMTTCTNKFGRESLKFMGINQESKKWEWIETHGGKLTENIIQAIARDCLAETMTLVEKAGIPVVFHVHDELICEVPNDSFLDRIQDIFKITPSWADGLPLKGAGYATPYYKKD